MAAAYDQEAILARVYDAMCEGHTVDDICAADDMPNTSTVYRWLVDSEHCEEYARAKAVRAELLANKVITTAESEELKPDDKRVRIDAYKWAAGKLSGKYSDKVKHVGGDEGDAPIRTEGRTVLDMAGLNDEQLRALASIRVPTE
jgi:hypothetical protein